MKILNVIYTLQWFGVHRFCCLRHNRDNSVVSNIFKLYLDLHVNWWGERGLILPYLPVKHYNCCVVKKIFKYILTYFVSALTSLCLHYSVMTLPFIWAVNLKQKASLVVVFKIEIPLSMIDDENKVLMVLSGLCPALGADQCDATLHWVLSLSKPDSVCHKLVQTGFKLFFFRKIKVKATYESLEKPSFYRLIFFVLVIN